MPQESPTYDLMLLLSTGVEDERRAKILQDVEGTITGGEGSIVHNADWGTRPLTFRIQHQTEAEYHLLQFTGPTSLLESLGHNLGITDGVLRHRIIKVLPGTPPPPTPERVAPPAPPAAAPEPAPAAAEHEGAEAPESTAPAESSAESVAQSAPEPSGQAEAPAGTAAAEDAPLGEDADE
jgi:small subunit ribosomal protein S6